MNVNEKEMTKLFQRAMNTKGEALVVDGIPGPATQKAASLYDFSVSAERITLKTPTTPPPKPVTRDIIPFAQQAGVRMPTRGTYAGGWPKGAVVHYTAGGNGSGAALAAIKGGVANGYTYLAIDRDGTLFQAHPVSQWGYHAGQSLWKGYVGGLNDEAIGIEICCLGILTKGKDGILRAWTGKVIPESDARYVTQEVHGCPTGWYQKYSPEQEATLVKVLKWLKENDPTGSTFKYENIVGHHECSGLKGLGFWRKSDPGGSLSISMDQLRHDLSVGNI